MPLYANKLTCNRRPKRGIASSTLLAGSLVGTALLMANPDASLSQPYTFATIAGTAGDEAGVGSTADGTNGHALFFSPYGCAVDGAGNVYVSDGDAIRRASPVGSNWVVTTLAGSGLIIGAMNGSNSDALFDFPQGIAVDAAGNLYVADTANNAIRKVAAVGTNWVVTTLAGFLSRGTTGHLDGTNSSALFNGPYGIAVDANTNIYVADTYNDTIRKVTPVGTNWVVTTLAGSPTNAGSADGTNGVARFSYPAAIAMDTNGNLYVADFGNDTVRKIVQSGTNWVVTTLAGLAGSSGSHDGTNSNARFSGPEGLAVGASGQLFVSDSFNNTIRGIQPVGTNWVVTTLAGSAGTTGSSNGTGTAALFNVPQGIAMNQAGSLYVCDSANYTLRQGTVAALLQIAASSGHVVLTWPTGLAGYVCEVCSNSLAGPWSANTNGITASGGTLVQTNAVHAGSVFFRLHKP
jgi:sugar lactone lactonase YvrE